MNILILVLWIMCNSKYIKSAHSNTKEKDEKSDRPNIFLTSKNIQGKEHDQSAHSFSYSGPKGSRFWKIFYPTCGGTSQSPIDIRLDDLKMEGLSKLKWSPAYSKVPSKMIATNNGHTVKIQAQFPDGSYASIKGGPLNGVYNFQEVHFHWGTDDHLGSEHTIDGKSFPMEAHLVHSRSNLPTMKKAMESPGGIVVIGYLFEVSQKDNQALNSLLQIEDKLMKDLDVPLALQNTFPLKDLALPFRKEFVSYNGSLTTPPCSESVIWIMSPYTLDISEAQLKLFRDIARAHTGMSDNYRPTQALNGRNVMLIT